MAKHWVVVGISGVTCGGKTTLAKRLFSELPGCVSISQDDYFHPPESRHHTYVESIGHINWEIMSSLDMEKMRADVKNILSGNPAEAMTCGDQEPQSSKTYPNVLILEGFLLLNDDVLSDLCNLRYYVTLSREQCWERRRVRVYNPPDVPGYFDTIVWPEYVRHRDAVLSKQNVNEIDGMKSMDAVVAEVLKDVSSILSEKD